MQLIALENSMDIKTPNCMDCRHFILIGAPGNTDLDSRWCKAPQLKDVLDTYQPPANTVALCDATRDFKFACGHKAAWFEPKLLPPPQPEDQSASYIDKLDTTLPLLSDEELAAPKTTLTDGSPVTPDHKDINPATGMQKGYVVLSEAERAKGFVRPVRTKYVHTGKAYGKKLRSLTPEEHKSFNSDGNGGIYDDPWIWAEELPEGRRQLYTEKDMEKGCGAVTIMNQALAETYARNPRFYGGTFCVGCKAHLPLAEFRWDGTDEVVGS